MDSNARKMHFVEEPKFPTMRRIMMERGLIAKPYYHSSRSNLKFKAASSTTPKNESSSSDVVQKSLENLRNLKISVDCDTRIKIIHMEPRHTHIVITYKSRSATNGNEVDAISQQINKLGIH